jgi:hypothetical protein
MPQVKMNVPRARVIRSRQVLAAPPDEPLVGGNGETDYLCAGCSRVLAEGISLGQIKALVFECASCGTCNEVL